MVVKATKLRAAFYGRMSDDDQENSIDRQREQVRQLALQLGADIVAEYIDLGVPGDEREFHRRTKYHEMCRDAGRRPRPFNIVLMDKQDRLSRQTPRQFIVATDPL